MPLLIWWRKSNLRKLKVCDTITMKHLVPLIRFALHCLSPAEKAFDVFELQAVLKHELCGNELPVFAIKYYEEVSLIIHSILRWMEIFNCDSWETKICSVLNHTTPDNAAYTYRICFFSILQTKSYGIVVPIVITKIWVNMKEFAIGSCSNVTSLCLRWDKPVPCALEYWEEASTWFWTLDLQTHHKLNNYLKPKSRRMI